MTEEQDEGLNKPVALLEEAPVQAQAQGVASLSRANLQKPPVGSVKHKGQ